MLFTQRCRICFEEEGILKKVCDCNDTIHIDCLNKWRRYSGRTRCEVCNKRYPPNILNCIPIMGKIFTCLIFNTLIYLVSGLICYYMPILEDVNGLTKLLAGGFIFTHGVFFLMYIANCQIFILSRRTCKDCSLSLINIITPYHLIFGVDIVDEY